MAKSENSAKTIWTNPGVAMDREPSADPAPTNGAASPFAYAGLTGNPLPVGWQGPLSDGTDDAAAVAAAAPAGKAVPLYPAMTPKGMGRWWRYFWGLVTMLRSAPIVRSYPVHLQLEVTNACNLHCTTCSRDVLVGKPSLLEEEEWKTIIDDMKPTNINVSGIGEPFLHPRIFDIITYAKAKGAAINCATNFTRVRGRHREIVECGIDQLKVSIDATTPETFQRIRGEDSFDEIVTNIREVNAWKQRLGSKTPSVRFNFALQCYNYEQAADLVDLAAELGVDGIYFQFLSYVDMEDRKTMLTSDMTQAALRAVLDDAEQRAKKHNVLTNLDFWRRDFDIFWRAMQPLDQTFEPNDKRCYFPWISTWLGADGWVRPCPIMPWTLDEGRMGHIGEQSFAEIWNNPKYQALRQSLARGERPTRSCKTCYPQDLYNIISLKSKLLP